ncbi:hypothetical protein C6341_g21885 [Phytophthora cactorum]|nr:hypothetical protein C6341_g21885 [Phytophthora cactorum]
MKQNSTCGDDLKTLTTQVWMTVDEYRQKNPKISEAELRFKMSESDLILYDIPTVTNNCMPKMISESTVATAYKTRETPEDVHSDDQRSHQVWQERQWYIHGSQAQRLYMAPYTICGPTQFMGEVDDGNEAATLGMSALHKAFKNSTLSWTKKGDGAVIINFKSKDTKDVTVNIMSAGDKIDEVDLKAGGTA